jgi:hypothetical protein
MRDNNRFRDVRSGQGPVNVGRGNRAAGRDYQDNRSWRHVDNRGGHYVGGNYHVRHGDHYDIDAGPTDPFDAMASGRGIGRLLTAIGMIIAFAGFGGVGWVIVSFVITMGPDTEPTNPFSKELNGIPILPVAMAAFVIGGVLGGIGASMAKAARRRHERRMRHQRGYY